MTTKVERLATQLLAEAGIRHPPVDVERLATAFLGLSLYREQLESSVSGMLHRADSTISIAVNADHAHVRQRFTVAHEIGHFKLHRGRPVIVDHLIRAHVSMRNQESSLATSREEIEANGFAAALLMPAQWIIEDVNDRLGMAPGRLVAELAKRYQVSSQAMELRLINLGIRAAP
jgi:Zn-dependent peptidase ImmA (M78 family)